MNVLTPATEKRSTTRYDAPGIADRVLIAMTARFMLPGGQTKITTIEDRMPVRGLLVASDLQTAIEYFLSHCDAAIGAADVTSLIVSGHEMVHTFRDHPRPQHQDGCQVLL